MLEEALGAPVLLAAVVDGAVPEEAMDEAPDEPAEEGLAAALGAPDEATEVTALDAAGPGVPVEECSLVSVDYLGSQQCWRNS